MRRITVSASAKARKTLEAAASIAGTTVSQFVVQAALREAEQIIGQGHVVRSSVHNIKAFIRALENPPPPNAKLTAAIRRYRKLKRDDADSAFDWKPRPKRS